MENKIIFFGSGPYVVQVIKVLDKKFGLALVVTTEKNPGDAIPKFCIANNIEYIYTDSLSEPAFMDKLKAIGAKLAVLASLRLFIPDEILNSFELGIINIHPSLLPKYRGPTPVQTALLNGDTSTGVSIIKLDSEIDHGPILARVEERIEQNDTADSLYTRLFKIGGELLLDVLPKYISGDLKPTDQDHSKATYTERDLSRESGLIYISKPPSPTHLPRMIKAYYPWPGVWFKEELNGKEKVIKLLPENHIQVEGKNIMTYKDFANGYAEGHQILQKLNINE